MALVEKIDAGPEGRHHLLPQQPRSPIRWGWCSSSASITGTMKVRPDQKVVVARDWPTPELRLKGAQAILGQLAKLAKAA